MEDYTKTDKNIIFTKANSFIYLLVLALGVATAIIFYMRSQTPSMTKEEKEIEQIKNQSSSDEINQIEADLENTELNSVDRELTNIEAEFEAGY